MLIKVTQCCSMGCSHCMNNAVPCDRHMTIDTFKDVLAFIKKYDGFILGDTLTGGEPFEHPNIWELVDIYFKTFPFRPLTIATNGLYLQNNQEIVTEKCDKYPLLLFQVTNDTRYYPIKLDLTKRIFRRKKQIYIVTEISHHLTPKGRAKINHPEEKGFDNKCPACMNVKLMALQTKNGTLSEVFDNLRMNNKKCIPSIQYNGNIAFGEFDDCPGFVSIYDDEKTIYNSILTFSCDRCPELKQKMIDNIDSWLPKTFLDKYKNLLF